MPIEVYRDTTRTILSNNDSPDVGFRWSVNPYRGCTHSCSYCYARPTHEFLDFGAGTDFDRKIVVKTEAPALLRSALSRPSWKGELVFFSGATDCYQPLEASYRLTRQCLEVCRDLRNPVGILTKSALIERDIELLAELAQVTEVRVAVSIPMWNKEFARALESQVAHPQRRMQAVARLRAAGVPAGVAVAPFVPTLSEDGLAGLMAAAAEADAQWIGMGMLRLRPSVRDVFIERLRARLPDRADRVLSRVRDTYGGQLDDSRFGRRMEGTGPYAAAARALFRRAATAAGLTVGGLDQQLRTATAAVPHAPASAGRPAPAPVSRKSARRSSQLSLFDDSPPARTATR